LADITAAEILVAVTQGNGSSDGAHQFEVGGAGVTPYPAPLYVVNQDADTLNLASIFQDFSYQITSVSASAYNVAPGTIVAEYPEGEPVSPSQWGVVLPGTTMLLVIAQ
jgi:hypothetical protein